MLDSLSLLRGPSCLTTSTSWTKIPDSHELPQPPVLLHVLSTTSGSVATDKVSSDLSHLPFIPQDPQTLPDDDLVSTRRDI